MMRRKSLSSFYKNTDKQKLECDQVDTSSLFDVWVQVENFFVRSGNSIRQQCRQQSNFKYFNCLKNKLNGITLKD